MTHPLPKVGDAVLVCNDFSTPEDWPYPGIVTEVDDTANPGAVIMPLSSLVGDGKPMPVFARQCRPLITGTLNESYLDRPTKSIIAYIDPTEDKVYFPDQPNDEDQSFLEQEFWFETNTGIRFDGEKLNIIGALEMQPED